MSAADGRKPAEEEDASSLKFGEDFEDAHCLLNAEVALILEHKLKEMQPGVQMKSNFQKAYEYVNRVKQFSDRETVQRVRQDLEKQPGLREYEIAQLGNLCPEDGDEARTLVPSLGQLEGRVNVAEQLNEVLQAIGDCKQLT